MAEQVQVQLRVAKKTVGNIDSMVRAGRFKSRSDAIKAMIFAFEEKEKTRKFLQLLLERSKESSEKPGELVPFSEI